jgi:cytochrome c
VPVWQLHDSIMTEICFLGGCRGLAVWILLGASSSPAVADSDVARGEVLVRTNCSPCHAVGLTDTSPHPDAPAFRTLSEHYPIEDLAEALAEGISSGHPDMPEFVASPDQIDAIIACIRSLQRK